MDGSPKMSKNRKESITGRERRAKRPWKVQRDVTNPRGVVQLPPRRSPRGDRCATPRYDLYMIVLELIDLLATAESSPSQLNSAFIKASRDDGGLAEALRLMEFLFSFFVPVSFNLRVLRDWRLSTGVTPGGPCR